MDSSESQSNSNQLSGNPSTNLSEEQWISIKKKILELHQAKAETYFTLIKTNYPDENLYSLRQALLILLIPILDEPYQKEAIKLLSMSLDAEVELGLLSLQEKPETP
jgi:hypothetical protein